MKNAVSGSIGAQMCFFTNFRSERVFWAGWQMFQHVLLGHPLGAIQEQFPTHHPTTTSRFPQVACTYRRTLAVVSWECERSGAAAKRRGRRLRAQWRHEQQSIATALATALHHSARRRERGRRRKHRPKGPEERHQCCEVGHGVGARVSGLPRGRPGPVVCLLLCTS